MTAPSKTGPVVSRWVRRDPNESIALTAMLPCWPSAPGEGPGGERKRSPHCPSRWDKDKERQQSGWARPNPQQPELQNPASSSFARATLRPQRCSPAQVERIYTPLPSLSKSLGLNEIITWLVEAQKYGLVAHRHGF